MRVNSLLDLGRGSFLLVRTVGTVGAVRAVDAAGARFGHSLGVHLQRVHLLGLNLVEEIFHFRIGEGNKMPLFNLEVWVA